jgi:hypothetical protein
MEELTIQEKQALCRPSRLLTEGTAIEDIPENIIQECYDAYDKAANTYYGQLLRWFPYLAGFDNKSQAGDFINDAFINFKLRLFKASRRRRIIMLPKNWTGG